MMEKALVAVSGGGDSMALLDILVNNKEYELVVCHVNYHYRDSSLRDEKIVEDYCDKNKIKCYILSLNSKEIKEGNFEDWARVKRYKFFKEVYDKENCVCLFVGHQKEDVIETYLMQKNRGAIVELYGLAKETNLQGMKVIRPLLNYTKKELETYCVDNKIIFGVDETNFDLTYSRNKIRHEVISKMSEEEKDKLIKEIEYLNKNKTEHVNYIKQLKKTCIDKENILSLERFNDLELEEKKEVLYYFLIDNLYKKISIKKTRLLDILKKIDSNKPNIVLAEYDGFTLYKEYKYLVIEENKKEYCYDIVSLEKKEICDEYVIKDIGKRLERVVVSKNRFPLQIKNYDGKNKDINRIFIDKKIPLRQRKNWPVIVDKFGALLLVIGIKKFYNELSQFEEDRVEFYVCKNKGE